MTTSAVGLPQSSGVEMRVHGVGGGHEVFRALGRPVYKEAADARVRVGSLPRLPKHELKLINWGRPRKISGNLSWYLAYPFTVLNVAGYMGPERSEDRSEKRLWWFMRAGIVVSSLMMTFAMAAWITVILETGWRLLGGTAEGLSTTILGAFAPGLLAAFIVNRMVRGRPLADKGNCWVSLLNLAVLLGTAVYLAGRPASKDAIFDFGDANARDPMTLMIITTTVVMWTFALALCFIAWRAEYRRRQQDWAEPDRTALAGAGILIALAIAILHTGGSILRLALQTVLKYAPPGIEPLTYDPRVHAVLLPPPDDLEPRAVVPTRDYFTQLLPIDLVPVFFLATVAILGVLVWREFRLRKPKFSEESTHSLARKQVAPFHVVIEETHEFLARTGIVAMVGSIGMWLVLAAAVFAASNHGWGKDEWVVPLMVGLKIAGLVLLVIIVARRPDTCRIRAEATLRVIGRHRRILGARSASARRRVVPASGPARHPNWHTGRTRRPSGQADCARRTFSRFSHLCVVRQRRTLERERGRESVRRGRAGDGPTSGSSRAVGSHCAVQLRLAAGFAV